MIVELFTYLHEKFRHRNVSPFGHLTESISLREKERRCRQSWLPHLQHCQEFIINHCQNLPSKRSVVVLGSGPLHEIPIEWLASSFNRVKLVDVVHLQSTKRQYAHLTNLEFITHDVTELEADLLQGILHPKIPVRRYGHDCDVVISANILSQIPLHLDRFLRKKFKHLSESDRENYLLQSQLNHLSYLKSFDCTVLLYTDVERRYLDKTGTLLETERGHELYLPEKSKEWIWDVSPLHEYARGVQVKMLVQGFILNSKKRD